MCVCVSVCVCVQRGLERAAGAGPGRLRDACVRVCVFVGGSGRSGAAVIAAELFADGTWLAMLREDGTLRFFSL